MITGVRVKKDMLDWLTITAEAIWCLQKGQTKLKSTLDSKLDEIRKELISSIDEKFKAMKTVFQLEIGKQQAQTDTIKHTIDSMVNRLNELENVDRTQQEFIHEHDNTH